MLRSFDKYEAVVVGASAGGLGALTDILGSLPASYPLPIIVVQHRSNEQPTLLEEVLANKCQINIRQAEEKESILSGTVYFAPPDYHLLIEEDRTFSLSFDPPVNFSRPAIDVLFETAAVVYGRSLVAAILTGASSDGAEGIRAIRKAGGTTIAQSPHSAPYPTMPRAAIDTGCVDHIFELHEITNALLALGEYHS